VPKAGLNTWVRELLQTGTGALAFLVIIIIPFLLALDKPGALLAKLRGESISADPAVTNIGQGEFGTERAFSIRLTNWSDQPIRIIGGTSDCSCIATSSLPVTLAPGKTESVEVVVMFRGDLGRFQRRFDFLADHDSQRLVTARFVGRVVEVRD
jgi:hypothetical protein